MPVSADRTSTMGNVESSIEAAHPPNPNSCIVEVVSLQDCPQAQALRGGRYKQLMNAGTLQTSVHVRCYLSLDITRLEDPEQRFVRISEPVSTPRKPIEGGEGYADHRWNCYRDLQQSPPPGAFLTVEVCCRMSKNKSSHKQELSAEAHLLCDPLYSSGVDATADNVIVDDEVTRITEWTMGSKKQSAIFSSDSSANPNPSLDSSVVGFAHIPVSAFDGERVLTMPLHIARGSYAHSCGKRYPNFCIQLRRAFTKSSPPVTRTVFLVRHGESRWNRAQDDKDIKGLLARDHPLTAGGMFQAQALNFRWKDFASAILPDQFASAAAATVSPDSDDSEDDASDAERITVTGADASDAAQKAAISAAPDLVAVSRKFFERACDESGLPPAVDDDDEGSASDNGADPLGACSPPPTSSSAADTASTSSGLRPKSTSSVRAGPRTAPLVSRISEAPSSNQLPPKYRHLRRQHLRRLFLESTAIYSSPLTRAVQTAYLALSEHPCIVDRGVELYSVIREFKGPTGFDAVGVACSAAAIKERAQREMQCEQPEPFVRHVTAPELREGDAAGPWWTPLSSFDSAADRNERMSEFVNFTRYCDGGSPVFVGHSLFFRQFCASRISTYLKRNRPALASRIKKFKLANATLLAVTLQYNVDSMAADGSVGCTILDADLICGGGFHADNYEEERLSERFGPSAAKDVEQELARPSVFARLGAAKAEGVRMSAHEGLGMTAVRQRVSTLFSSLRK